MLHIIQLGQSTSLHNLALLQFLGMFLFDRSCLQANIKTQPKFYWLIILLIMHQNKAPTSKTKE